MKLETIFAALQDFILHGEREKEVFHITDDSRDVKPNTLFICIKGYTVDGHDYIEKAIANGATVIIGEKSYDDIKDVFEEGNKNVTYIQTNDIEKKSSMLSTLFYDAPSQHFHLTGVTGTNGKTSITTLLNQIYKRKNKTTGLIGTMHNEVAGVIKPTKNTTPNPFVLQSLFHQMKEKEVECAVMEVSSHGLSLGRVDGTQFDIAILTNLTQDHLDYHHTMEEYKEAKGKLFHMLQKDGTAILNQDDESFPYFSSMTKANIVTYGIEKESAIMAKHIHLTADGMSFDLYTPMGSIFIETHLIGKFNVYNLLAIAGVLLEQQYSLQDIQTEFLRLEGVSGRMEVVSKGYDVTVVVDYAHTPDALENVLSTIKEMEPNKRVVNVFGCGGDRDRTKRPLMAKVSEQYASQTILTNDNPRTEEPKQIFTDMLEGIHDESKTIIEPERTKAIQLAISQAQKGDIVIIAGKGHETYQIVGTEVLQHDDRLVAKKILEDLYTK